MKGNRQSGFGSQRPDRDYSPNLFERSTFLIPEDKKKALDLFSMQNEIQFLNSHRNLPKKFLPGYWSFHEFCCASFPDTKHRKNII